MFEKVKRRRALRRELRPVLEAVNEQRAIRDLPPLRRIPKARPGNQSECCPMAVALGQSMGITLLQQPDGKHGDMPEAMTRFIVAYDNGAYPELRP